MSGAPRHIARYAPSNVASAEDGRLFSPSYERNFAPIRTELSGIFAGRSGAVLEIGSGTGQHAAGFARAFPGVRWLPSDPDDGHLASIRAWGAAGGEEALSDPLQLDATSDWAAEPALLADLPLLAVYAMNVIHISPWSVAEGIVAGAGRAVGHGGHLILYGPYREGGQHTGDGNARFDAALRAENPDWGVRDVEEVAALADGAGFGAPELRQMPSNNRLLIFTRL